MARHTEKLTARKVATINKPGRYSDGLGLYLQVMPSGVKSWILRYERDGRERTLGLGPLHTVGLGDARERARRARLQLLDGVDPIDERRRERAERALEAQRRLTFEAAARAYYAQHEARWSNAKHRTNFISSLERFAFPVVGRLDVADIETGHVLRILEPIWTAKNETASKLRQRLQAVLDWATVRGHRRGDNPAAWRGHLENVLPPPSQVQRVVHQPAMRYEDVPALMSELRSREGIAARALELMILTATRTTEVIGARWSEVDLDARTWTIPAERMKARRAHRVPLAERAVELLRALPRDEGGEFVFVSSRSKGAGLSNMAMANVLKKIHEARAEAGLEPWADRETGKLAVPHGFRSSFRDWAGERTSYPNYVVEQALAHTIGAVEKAYRRGDLLAKRARLMAEWAKHCGTTPAAGKVVSLRARS